MLLRGSHHLCKPIQNRNQLLPGHEVFPHAVELPGSAALDKPGIYRPLPGFLAVIAGVVVAPLLAHLVKHRSTRSSAGAGPIRYPCFSCPQTAPPAARAGSPLSIKKGLRLSFYRSPCEALFPFQTARRVHHSGRSCFPRPFCFFFSMSFWMTLASAGSRWKPGIRFHRANGEMNIVFIKVLVCPIYDAVCKA